MTYSASRKINNWHNWGCFRQSHLTTSLKLDHAPLMQTGSKMLVRVILLFIWSHTWWLITWWERNYVAPQDTKESMRGRPWVRGPVGAILQRVISFCSWHYVNKVHHIPCSTCNANTVTHNLRLWADRTILYEYGRRCNEDLTSFFPRALLCTLLLASW